MNKDSLGARAEEAVARYIEERGWRVRERNVARPWGEIDIVAQEGDILVCVEVKAGYRREGFAPEDHFDGIKRAKVARACQEYATRNGFSETACRVDLASVAVDAVRSQARIHYYKNVGQSR